MANKPIDALRDGALKATIWKQKSEKGTYFYSVNLSRSFQDANDEWHDTNSFSGSELLKIARLAERAYDRTQELRQEDRDDPQP